jgi:hypothetical protein
VLINHRVEAYQGYERALVAVESIQSACPNAADNYLIGKACTAAHFALNQGNLSKFNDEEITSGDDALAVNGAEDTAPEKSAIKEHLDDAGPEAGPQSLFSITLAVMPGIAMPSLLSFAYSDHLCPSYQNDGI